MKRIKLPKSELIVQLKEQLGFIITSCSLFDEGAKEEGKRLSTHLRILLHDTRVSKSLLGQLGLKSIRFLNTSPKYYPANLVSYVGLLSFRFDSPSGRRPWIIPKGDPDPLPKKSKLSFPVWWNMPVIVANIRKKNITFSRKDIILHVANTDGGSHVDDTLDRNYMALSRWNAIGIASIQNGIEMPIENPILPCARQVAHEVLRSLQSKRPELFKKQYIYKRNDSPPPNNPGTGVPTVSKLLFRMID